MEKSDFYGGYISAEKHLNEIGVTNEYCDELLYNINQSAVRGVVRMMLFDASIGNIIGLKSKQLAKNQLAIRRLKAIRA